MDFEDKKCIEIGNYAKGWYGDFTGAGNNSFHDLAIIFGHLCGLSPNHVEHKHIFLEVYKVFHRLAHYVDPHHNWTYNELFTETFFPDKLFPNTPDDPPETRMLNKMLRIIAQIPVKHFPSNKMKLDHDIAKLFPNWKERIQRYKELGFDD